MPPPSNKSTTTRTRKAREALTDIENAPVPASPSMPAELLNKAILERLEKVEAENQRLRSAQQPADSGEGSVSIGEGAAAEYERKLAELEKKCNELEAAQSTPSEPTTDVSVADGSIPRPRGTAGQNFSIQVAMGLAGSEKKHLVYQGIMRGIRDLALRGDLNWELPWKEIPMDKKVKVFQLARDSQPFLRRFRNDWATEEILKQYFKNRRSYGYVKGFLEPPTKYAYLKVNAGKRSKDGSRTKKAKAILAAKKKDKVSRASSGKGKRRARVVVDDEDDEEQDAGSAADSVDGNDVEDDVVDY